MVDLGVVSIEMVIAVVQSIYTITNLLGVNVKHWIFNVMPHISMSAIIQQRGHQLNDKKKEHSSYIRYKGKVYMDLNS